MRIIAHLTFRQMVPDPQTHRLGVPGTLTGTLNGRMLHWHLASTHPSGAATSAKLHKGKRGVNGPRFRKLCGPCHSPKYGVLVLSQTI